MFGLHPLTETSSEARCGGQRGSSCGRKTAAGYTRGYTGSRPGGSSRQAAGAGSPRASRASSPAAARVSAPAAVRGPGLCRQWACLPGSSPGGGVRAEGRAADAGGCAVKNSRAAARRARRRPPPEWRQALAEVSAPPPPPALSGRRMGGWCSSGARRPPARAALRTRGREAGECASKCAGWRGSGPPTGIGDSRTPCAGAAWLPLRSGCGDGCAQRS